MFKNIKKLSEHSLLNEKLIYTIREKEADHAPKAPKKTPEEVAKEKREKLHRDMDSLVFQHEGKILKLLVEGSEYKSGDWRALNVKFAKEFAKEGIEKGAAERLLKRFQTEAFASLGLDKDVYAKADGKLGPYSLYAFALYFNLKRPKVLVPAGSRQLEALINKDIEKALGFYKEFPFAKNANMREFKKIYKDIMANNSSFNPDSKYAELGNWAVALWEAGYSDRMLEKIGFPRLYAVDPSKYTYASDMKLRIILEGEEDPIFVNREGKLFELAVYEEELEPSDYDPKKSGGPGKKTPTKPAVPKARPEPKKAPKPAPRKQPDAKPRESRDMTVSQFEVKKSDGSTEEYYRFSDGTYKNSKYEDVPASEVLPLIASETYQRPSGEKYYMVKESEGSVTAYYDESGKRLTGRPSDATKMPKLKTA